MRCPDCGGAMNVDEVHAEEVCDTCGLVSPLAPTTHWDSSMNAKPSAGPRIEDPKARKAANRLARTMRRNANRDSQRLREEYHRRAINDIARAMQAPDWAAPDAEALLHKLLQKRFILIHRRAALVTALLVTALRARGMPMPLHEAAEAADVKRAEVVRYLNLLRSNFPEARVQLDVAALANSYAIRLQVPHVGETAAQTARDWLDRNENPLVVAAAACFHAIELHGEQAELAQVAEVAHVGEGYVLAFLKRHGAAPEKEE